MQQLKCTEMEKLGFGLFMRNVDTVQVGVTLCKVHVVCL